MRTIRLTIEYDGTDYSGWQRQPNGLAVQQVIEEALYQLLDERVDLRSSGRTDAGVHARGMAAAFRTAKNLPLKAFVDGTNRFLPPDIAILEAKRHRVWCAKSLLDILEEPARLEVWEPEPPTAAR